MWLTMIVFINCDGCITSGMFTVYWIGSLIEDHVCKYISNLGLSWHFNCTVVSSYPPDFKQGPSDCLTFQISDNFQELFREEILKSHCWIAIIFKIWSGLLKGSSIYLEFFGIYFPQGQQMLIRTISSVQSKKKD